MFYQRKGQNDANEWNFNDDTCNKYYTCTISQFTALANISVLIYTFSADELDSFINEIANSGKCECSQCSGQDGFNISVALIPSINSVGYVWIYRKLTSLTSNENFICQSLSIITPIILYTYYLLELISFHLLSIIENTAILQM